jgi:hypothetical protein
MRLLNVSKEKVFVNLLKISKWPDFYGSLIKGSPSDLKEGSKRFRTSGIRLLRRTKPTGLDTTPKQNRSSVPESASHADTNGNDFSGPNSFFGLLCKLADIYRLFTLYKCKEVVQSITADLPDCQSQTGWAMVILARSHIELHDFREVSLIARDRYTVHPV